MQATAAKLPPQAFAKDVRPVAGLVDVDATELAARAVRRLVEKSEVSGIES